MSTSMPGEQQHDGLAHNLRRMVDETENFLQAAAQTGIPASRAAVTSLGISPI